MAVSCAALGLASAQPAGARASKIVYFRLPSNNIACAYVTGFGKPFLRCDLFSGLEPKPKGKCREGDWASVSMTKRGKAHPSCVSDSIYNEHAPFLKYGHTWKHFGFTCKSRRTGLTCKNAGHHGFFLSRQRWSVH
jgi:Family of unknown function (DUF6636)